MNFASLLLLAVVPQDFVSFELEIDASLQHVALRDMNRDGHLDLVVTEATGIRIFFQQEDGSFHKAADTQFTWPAQPLGWDLVDWDNDGSYELICLNDGASVTLYKIADEGTFGPPETLLEDAQGFLPPGLRRLRFARDVDGNGSLDIVIPSGSSYQLFLRAESGGFSEPHTVQFEADIRTEFGDVQALSSRVLQSTSIPLFKIKDIDGDGKADLVAETEDLVTFYINSDGLPSKPTWSLDLAALRASVPEQDGFSFDNLITSLTPSVRWRIAEIDGTGPAELIVQVHDTLKIYTGGARLGTVNAPTQLLRASGPILYFFIRDTTGDSLPELQIVRSDDLSLGRLVRWIILPGQLEFYIYTYINQAVTGSAPSFGLKPSKRNTLAIELPRLLSIEERIEELEEGFSDRLSVPARMFPLDRDGLANDVVDYTDGVLHFYRDRCPPDFDESIPGLAEGDLDLLIEHFILKDLDPLKDGKTKTFGLDDLFGLNFSRSHELRLACKGAESALQFPITFEEPTLTPCDYNGDGLTDLLVRQVGEDDTIHLLFLMRVAD